MSHEYLMALVDAGGTVPVELGVARRLVARGHRVTVLADDSMADAVRKTGACFRPWRCAPNRPDLSVDSDPLRDWECKNPLQVIDRLVRVRFLGDAERYAQDVGQALRELSPDLVLCSMFCFGGMLAAEQAGVPFDVLFPNLYMPPVDGMPPFGLGLTPARGWLGRLRDRALSYVTQSLWDKHGLTQLNALRAQRGLPRLEHFWSQMHRARRELVLSAQAFDFPARLPENVRHVGTILDDPEWAELEPWHAPVAATGQAEAEPAPLVLVALSSTYQAQLGTLQRICDGLAELPVRALVTTGPAIAPSSLRVGPNTQVLVSAPHTRVMRDADLVITHGGHGTVVKALAAGLPLLVMHHGRDQADNAVRVTAHGAGIALHRNAKSHAIARAVRQLLAAPAYRAQAQALGTSILADADGAVLLRELEDLPAPCAHAERTQRPADGLANRCAS